MLRSWFRRVFPDRRAISAREPVFFGARLELDVVDVEGVARDVGPGGLFFTALRHRAVRPGSASRSSSAHGAP
jgi:hypothetical protein